MPFSSTWAAVRVELAAGTPIDNWTVLRGQLGDSFVVTRVDADCVEVDSPGARTLQRIPMNDFERVYELWGGYLDRRVQRQEIRDVTRYSTYIISIFHWLETRRDGELP